MEIFSLLESHFQKKKNVRSGISEESEYFCDFISFHRKTERIFTRDQSDVHSIFVALLRLWLE